jgi:hypothetical protein
MTPERLAERYREHWGFLDELQPIRRHRGRPVRCVDYPELPAFGSVTQAAGWAGVKKATLVQSIKLGIRAAGVRFEYADGATPRMPYNRRLGIG